MNQKAREYILDQLKELHIRVEGIKIRYEFNDDLNTHLVEVLPLSLYEDNQEYILAEMEFEEEFRTEFPEEEILFVSADSLNQVENASFSFPYQVIDRSF